MRMSRRFLGGAVAVVLLGSAGGALAVTSGTSSPRGDRDAFLNDVAGRLNVTPEKLKSAVQGAFEDQLDAAVKAGRLTQAQADEMKKEAREHGGVPFGPGPGPFHGGPPPPFHGGPPPGA